MNRLKEIKELKALAEELQLENREIIRKYKITELASIYNGIGPGATRMLFEKFVDVYILCAFVFKLSKVPT